MLRLRCYALENYLYDTRRKLIRILLSRTAAREKKEGEIYSRRAAYGATSEAALLRLLKFQGWKRPPFLSLLDSCASLSAPRILFEDTRLLLHLFLPPPFLTHETSYNPSFYPSGVARSCLSKSRNDYRYGRRWPNIRVNPSVELEVLPTRISERKNRIFFRNICRNISSVFNAL